MRKVSDFFWGNLFKIASLRNRLAFQVKYRCWNELDLRLSLGHDLWVPWCGQEAAASFVEIFLEQEYAGMLKFMLPPTRWIDLGAFAGFFSLWLKWMRKRLNLIDPPCEALLIDADESQAPVIANVLRVNNLSEVFHFHYGAIGAGGGSCRFVRMPYMRSALASIAGSAGQALEVPILTGSKIMSLLGPPYDLIKVDIEGAEYELLQNYRDLLSHCKHLLLEWHSWHSGGGGANQLRELAAEAGFRLVAELAPVREVSDGQKGISLWCRAEETR